MRYQRFDKSPEVFLRANELAIDGWRTWEYRATGKKLVLFGYANPFDVKAYMVFRGTSYIAWGGDRMGKALFGLAESSNDRKQDLIRRGILTAESCLVVASRGPEENFFGCESVSCYVLSREEEEWE